MTSKPQTVQKTRSDKGKAMYLHFSGEMTTTQRRILASTLVMSSLSFAGGINLRHCRRNQFSSFQEDSSYLTARSLRLSKRNENTKDRLWPVPCVVHPCHFS